MHVAWIIAVVKTVKIDNTADDVGSDSKAMTWFLVRLT